MIRILFQLNLARMRVPFGDPLFDDFKAQLHKLHEAACSNPGWLWRYQGEKDKEGFIKPYLDQPLIMGNMSAWRDYKSLYEYTFSEGHLEILKSKRKWFEQMQQPYTVLYYGVEGDLMKSSPELLEEAKRRLNHLARYGESCVAFGFGSHKGIL